MAATPVPIAIEQLLHAYRARTPVVRRVEGILTRFTGGASIVNDHIAFRTFGARGFGIESIAPVIDELGYTARDTLTFPAKKLHAQWFAPPPATDHEATPLPRVFVSELKVHELPQSAQDVISRQLSTAGNPAAAFSEAAVQRPWAQTATEADYDELAAVSEYASWVLAHGYALNHMTVAVHRLPAADDPAKPAFSGGIRQLNEVLLAEGVAMNQAGGLLKVSPDGGLLQSSTVADEVEVQFACGMRRRVPGAYLEFAERLVLPQFAHLPADEIREEHRREGFETANADGIFESTSVRQRELVHGNGT